MSKSDPGRRERRIGLAVLACAALICCTVPIVAEAQAPCDAETVLERHLAGYPAHYVLAYDHDRGAGWWRGYHWDGNGLDELGEPRFEIRPDGHPRLTVPRGSSLAAYVVGTNPLAYTVTANETSVAKHEDLADLQKFAGLLGGTLGSIVSLEARVAAAPSITTRDDTATRGVTPPPSAQWIAEVQKVVESSLASLEPLTVAMRNRQQALVTELGGVEAAERFLRAVETRDTAVLAALHRFRDASRWPSESAILRKFEDLGTARTALAAWKPVCPDELKALREAVELRLVADPESQAAYLRLALRLGRRGTCADPRLIDALVFAAAYFDHYSLSQGLPGDHAEALDALAGILDDYLAAVSARSTALTEAKTVLDGAKSAGATASYLRHVSSRLPAGLASDPEWKCALTHGVLRVERIDGSAVKVRWSEVRTEPFTIAFDGQLKQMTPTRPAKVDEEYQLATDSLFRHIDLDVGLTHSPIRQPSYGAVSGASLGDLKPADAADDDKFIYRTKTDRRSGVPAMFLSWFPGPSERRHLATGVQLGLGLDSDEPAIFAGPVLSLGRFVHLSGGWTWQRVDELVDELEVGDPVNSGDDIRLREETEDDWYVALTISLDNLPFFGGD